MKRMKDMKKIFMTVTLLALVDVAPRSFQGATITGQVVDARTFQPLRGAIVRTARVAGDNPDAPRNVGFRTGEDGKFILRGVLPGIVDFYVAKSGYTSGPFASVRPAADGERIENVVLTVPPAASISGRVTDESGQPIAGARVISGKPVQLDPKNQRTFSGLAGANVTDDDGQYWIGGLSAGEYVVSASPYGQVAATQSPADPSFGQPITVKLDVGEEKMGADVVVPLRLSSTPAVPRKTPQGTGAVSGRVIDTLGRSIPNAIVVMSPDDPKDGFTATTDSAGNFLISGVPAGTFGIGASAPGFPMGLQLETRPSMTPKTVAVKDRSSTNVTLTLRRGAVISGAITDEFGDPVSGSVTVAGPYSDAGIAGRTITVDARGRYRVTGLLPGEYLLSVQTPAGTEIHFEDYAGKDRVIAPAPVFYPGVPRASLASRVPVAEGRESTGIDFVLRPVAIAAINVTVTANQPVKSIQLHRIELDELMAIQRTVTLAGSSATLEVAPGRYRLLATAAIPSSSEKMTRLWSLMDVDADPLLPTTVTMALEPGANISGRVVYEGASNASRQGTNPWLVPVERLLGPRLGTSTFDAATGRFSIDGILPGRYVIQTGAGDGGKNSAWVLKAATAGGRDILEQPIALNPGTETNDVVLTVTDRIGELSGMVTDTVNQPVTNEWVVLFSVDRRHWYPGSRRTRVIRPNEKGAYVVRGLPAGSYYVALSSSFLSQDAALQPAMQTLATSGVRVTLAEGERKVQDLRSPRKQIRQ
jgi:protocatechuate 3,4-dioxygenase beta subunit